MAVAPWMMLLSLLVHSSSCTDWQITEGCMKWSLDKNDDRNVCCDSCHPGNRLVRECGPSAKDLCKPCKPQRFTEQPKSKDCPQCTQCVGAQVLVKKCTPWSDTVCGCGKGYACGDDRCSYCITACGKGQEPSGDGGCRTCPNGTFNNQTHHKCQPWSTRCPNPDQKIVAVGDAFNDIKCEDAVDPENYDKAWPFVWALLPILVLVTLIILIILIITRIMKLNQQRESEKAVHDRLVIRPPTDTDDHSTLIAIECSFHEAEQEQGSSLESLASESSTKELIE